MIFASWIFPETTPFQVQGRDLSEDNFAHEDRSSLELLIREVLQNPLDVRAEDNAGAVRVNIRVLQPGKFDADYLKELFAGAYNERLQAAGGEPLPDLAGASVLVLEDFGTTGLKGDWTDQNADGPGENWNAFWFREGEGAKASAGSNGRAGQGKITFYRISAARAVFGLTVRNSDGKKLLMGRSAFRRVYPFQGRKYLRHAFWCTGETHPLPVVDDDCINAFASAFSLQRKSESGLSLVIPFPQEFQPKKAIQTVIAEFYFPIAAGNLEISIGGMSINAANIDQIADIELPDSLAREIKSSFTKDFRKFARSIVASETNGVVPVQVNAAWERTAVLKEAAFPDGAIEGLRSCLEKGERISVRFPVSVRKKGGPTVTSYFDVHLQLPEDLDRVEEVYVRKDLLIGSEKHLGTSAHLQKARAATLVREKELSAFLADAEEPTHLKWNGSRPRLAEDYSNPQATLRAVRNAAPRLLALLSSGLIKRDVRALAKYFAGVAEVGKQVGAGGKKQGGQETPTDIVLPPAPVAKPFRIATGADTVQVLPNGKSAYTQHQLPISCALEVAYEGLDQKPFDAYDPFDFDLADEQTFAISVVGAKLTERTGNKIRFDVTDEDFKVRVIGFDPNIRLRARLTYTESENGSPVSEK